jgi:pyruvate carboxylase
VGDLALFMTSNNLNEEELRAKGATLSFPESVKGLLRGDLGQIPGGWPKWLQDAALKGEEPYTDLPNKHLAPLDFDAELTAFQNKFPHRCSFLDFLSYKMYPKVYEDFYATTQKYGDVWMVPTREFLYGMNDGDEITIEITKGKSVIIKKIATSSSADQDGARTVDFELNGQMRRVRIRDNQAKISKAKNRKRASDQDISAPLQGKISGIVVKVGDLVALNAPLFSIEAMKMESTVTAPMAGVVQKIELPSGTLVEQDDVVVVLG